jgi:hypothetical protein
MDILKEFFLCVMRPQTFQSKGSPVLPGAIGVGTVGAGAGRIGGGFCLTYPRFLAGGIGTG